MEKDALLAFGLKVATLRRHKGLSQTQLADQCGLHRTYIGGVERGERNIGLINIHRLAAALGVVAVLLVPAAAVDLRDGG